MKFHKDVISTSPVSATVFPKGSVTGCDTSLGGWWMIFHFRFLSLFFLSIGNHYTFSISFTTLRIGHILFSHQHLMEWRPIQYCEDCICRATYCQACADRMPIELWWTIVQFRGRLHRIKQYLSRTIIIIFLARIDLINKI